MSRLFQAVCQKDNDDATVKNWQLEFKTKLFVFSLLPDACVRID